MKSVALLRAAMCIAALLSVSCARVGGGSENGGRHAWTRPGLLRVAIAVGPNSLNPLLFTESIESMLGGLVFDPLVTIDERGRQVPRLASAVPTVENGGISRDGLRITYHLRRDVKWQDGVPFTSKDVAFSYRAVMSSANNVATRVGYDLVRSVETPDPFTVIFHMKKRFAPATNTLFAPGDGPHYVVPAHILQRYADLNRVPFNTAPIGTGPFRVTKWASGDAIEMVANDSYFLGRPKIRRIIVRHIPDENTEVNSLRTHEVDWVAQAAEHAYKDFVRIPDVRTVLVPENAYRGMMFNTARPVLADRRVRQAIAYAIDKDVLTRDVTYGSAKPATEDLPSHMWAYNPNVKRYPFSLEKARALLTTAGWTPGPGGVRQRQGERLELVLTLRQGAASDGAMSVQIQSWLRSIGIEVSIKTYPGSLLFAPAAAGGILTRGNYDLNLSGFASGVDPDNSAQFTSDNVAPKGYNWTRYRSPAMDAAQAQAVGTFDIAVRRRAYARIEELLAQDMPHLFIYWPRAVHAVNPDLRAFRPGPGYATWNASEWSI